MITPKVWKEYTAQVDLQNEMQWAECNAANERMRKDHDKKREEYYAKQKALAARMGTTPFIGMYPMCGFCMPILKHKTVEGCMTWIVQGKPTMAKKVKVVKDKI